MTKPTLKHDPVGPQPTSVESARQTLTTSIGDTVFKVWVLTKHIYSPYNDRNFVQIYAYVYKDGKVEIHDKQMFVFPLND